MSTLVAGRPVTYYRFSETEGTEAADSSTSGLTGTTVGEPTLGAESVFGEARDPAVELDGVDDSIEIVDDGRLDLEELGISCRKGVVYLSGTVPSEDEHQIAVRILTDVMGFSTIVDHLEITPLPWERDNASGTEKAPPLEAGKRKIYAIDDLAEGVFESEEEEKPYMGPDRPPPEKV